MRTRWRRRPAQRPRRSVLFACWGSEERGPLLGAWAYTETPDVSRSTRTVAVLNMDMVGRNEEVQVGGGPRFNGLEVQTAESNRNALNILGYSRHPELSAIVERVNTAALRPRAEDALRQQQLEPAAAQRPVAVPAERRAGAVVPHRACTPTTTRSTTGPRRSTTRRWRRSRGWCTRRAGCWPTRTAGRSSWPVGVDRLAHQWSQGFCRSA